MDFLHRTWAEIDISALVHNFKVIKNTACGCKIMSVVKANAYGHSASVIAPKLQELGTDFFAVSNIDEALQLRKIGIIKPILILGYTPVEMAETLNENDISQCVYSSDYAKALSNEAKKSNIKLKIHIKLDTGMSRLGFNCRTEELFEINDAINASKFDCFVLEGIFTHFASADRNKNDDDGFTDKQFERFTKALNLFKENGLNPIYKHCCNSAGLILDTKKQLDMSRPGIILYGLPPADDEPLKKDLIPVMTLKSVVSMVKEIAPEDTVSYGRTFKADKKMKIATVAAGYADGYPRALSSKGEVIINGQKAKILGRVCMDQMCVDVTHIKDVKMGDEVILFGKDLPVTELATLCSTINYELVCGISPRVPRIIKNEK